MPAPPPPINLPWCSFVEGRRPQYKFHKNRGQAYNAIMYQLHTAPRGGTIWEMVAGEWLERLTFHADLICIYCGKDSRVRVAGHEGHYCLSTVVDYKIKREFRTYAHYCCKKEAE